MPALLNQLLGRVTTLRPKLTQSLLIEIGGFPV